MDSVESVRCDIPVENFAESGKIMRKTSVAGVFSQAVENVLHNLNFPCKIRKNCPFLCILTHTFPQSVFGILHVVPTCGKPCEKAASEQCFLWNGMWKAKNVANMSYQRPLTSLISSLISTLKMASCKSFFSTVSIEDIMVEWSRPKILPMFGKDISVILRMR